MALPNFLIIGVQKAGTTSIYNYLDEHPQIYMSPVKETNFLEKDWENIEYKRKSSKQIKTFEQYRQLFDGVKDEIAIGEASPNYLFHYKTSSELILRHVPEAKLLAILRNPVERAYSDHLMHIRDVVNEKHLSLSDQVKYKADKSFLLLKGFYYGQLKYFYEKFDAEKIKIFLYDDLCKDPVAMMQDMYRFLSVDDTFVPDTSKKAQKAQVPKNEAVNKLLRKKNPLRDFAAGTLKLFLPVELRQKIRSTLINMNSQGKQAAPLSPEVRQQLIDLYREDVLKLQDLIQRDLSSWIGE